MLRAHRSDGNLDALVSATSFVGRAADLTALHQSASGARLVTVLGPPGAGKTRLATAYARAHTAEYLGGVWLCDLSEATTAEDVLSSIADTLGIDVGSERFEAAARSLTDAMVDRGELLLVLDELEHARAHAEETLGPWLRAVPTLRVLATSRERLQLAEEAVFDLGPLSLPDDMSDPRDCDAVKLFVERARAVRHGYLPSESEARDVAELVRMLDGLPLAIELAAARMRVLSPAQLVQQLGERFSLLSQSAAQLGRKQATLRAAIDASWRTLTAWERSALAQCSVFRGGFDVDAAAAVLDLSAEHDAPGVVDVLTALRDRSLLGVYEPSKTPGELRYALLLSIRDFAAERLAEDGGERDAMARHADHYARACSRWADELDGANERTARRRLALEAQNLLAIHQRAVVASAPDARRHAAAALLAIDPSLQAKTPRSVRLRLLDDALQFALGDPSEKTTRGALALHADAESDDARRALALAETTGDPRLVGRLLGGLGNMLVSKGELERAAAVYRRALSLEHQTGDRAAEAQTLERLGKVVGALGDAAEADRCARDALKLRTETAATADAPGAHTGATRAISGALVVSTSGRWFQAPHGEGVSVHKRRALRLVLKCLADERERAPGVALSLDALLEAGWPGQRVHPLSGASRVYNALSTLRGMGLRDVLLSRDDGYLLDPAVPISRSDDG